MKVEYTYGGLSCKFELGDEDELEVNPVPVLEALIKLQYAIQGYNNTSLTIKSYDLLKDD